MGSAILSSSLSSASSSSSEWYRSSVHKPTQKCTQLNGIDPVHVTKCGVRVYHHVPPIVLYVREVSTVLVHLRICHTMGYSLCTQQCKCVHKCIRLCEPA